MPIFVDTNILLRAAQPTHVQFAAAKSTVTHLLNQAETLVYCPQNITEFWPVATRPVDLNGLGFSVEEALAEIATIEGLLTLLPDSPAIHPEWKRIVASHRVQGMKVFDARLVAFMDVYGHWHHSYLQRCGF